MEVQAAREAAEATDRAAAIQGRVTPAQLTLDGAVTWNIGVTGAGVIGQHFIDAFQHIRGNIKSRP